MNKTLLVIAPGRKPHHHGVYNLLVAESGEHLASHFCSHAGYAYGDLYRNKPDRIKELKNRFGEIEVKFIDETSITEEELVKRNGQWFESLSEEE